MKSNTIFFAVIIMAGIIVMMFGLVGANSPGQSFISVDPIGDLNSGDLMIVSGATNLPIGTELMVQVIEEPAKSDSDPQGFAATGTGTSTKVVGRAGGANRWAVPIDTSVLRPDTYRVDVFQISRDPDTGNFTVSNTPGTARFNLTGEYLGPDLPIPAGITKDASITLDAVDARHTGDRFLVTGSTSLPVGTDVIWQVVPVFSESDSAKTGTFSGMMANSIVTRSNGEMNRVSYALDTTPLQPGVYNVTVSTVAGDIRKGDFGPGDVADSMEFTLQ